jgi:hypothetical protein
MTMSTAGPFPPAGGKSDSQGGAVSKTAQGGPYRAHEVAEHDGDLGAAAATPGSRESSSIDVPVDTRRTARRFRLADTRRRGTGAGASPPA